MSEEKQSAMVSLMATVFGMVIFVGPFWVAWAAVEYLGAPSGMSYGSAVGWLVLLVIVIGTAKGEDTA